MHGSVTLVSSEQDMCVLPSASWLSELLSIACIACCFVLTVRTQHCCHCYGKATVQLLQHAEALGLCQHCVCISAPLRSLERC